MQVYACELMWTCLVWAERSMPDSFWVPSHRFNSGTGEQKGITQTIYTDSKPLGKSELLVRDFPKPRSFWQLDQKVHFKSGDGALNIDPDMVAELTKAFQVLAMMAKVTDTASTYKVLAELYTSLFKTLKVEEEMVKQVRNIRPLAINPDLRRALETSFEASVASLQLGWHMPVLINYLYNHCQSDPVLNAVMQCMGPFESLARRLPRLHQWLVRLNIA